jgi:polyisoprenoid-binding protein YceI
MIRRLRSIALPFLALAALSAAVRAQAAPQTYEIDPVHSRVDFQIRHMFSKVSGGFTKFEGQVLYDPAAPAASSVKAVIDAASISTANEHRDADLRSPNFFDVAKFPTITFTSGKVTPGEGGRLKVEGTLTMHGVTKPVTFDAAFLGSGPGLDGATRAGFEAALKLDRKEFGIVWNKTLDQGTLLGDEVSIDLQIEAVVPRPESKEQPKKPAGEAAKESAKPSK